jgi:polyferredoxin
VKYNCFITLLSERVHNQFISRLLSSGLTVTSIGNALIDKNDDCIGCMLTIEVAIPDNHNLNKKDSNKTRSGLYTLLKETLSDLDMKYFSLVVTSNTGATWDASNVKMTKINERPTGSIYRDNAS